MELITESLRQMQNHNVIKELKAGDLVKFDRGIYSHWGVYIGNQRIIHLSGYGNDGIDGEFQLEHLFTISGETYKKARVCVDNIIDIVGEAWVENGNDDDSMRPLPVHEILTRAKNKLCDGDLEYNLIFSNCEHFANWCRYGVAKSRQVENVVNAGITIAGVAGVGLAIGAIGALVKYATTEEKESKKLYKK